MRSTIAILAAIILALILAGCSWDEAILRGERAVEVATKAVDKAAGSLTAADRAIATAREALATAEQIAAKVDNDQAKAAVSAAQDAVAKAEAARPAVADTLADARAALGVAETSLTAAKAAKDAGGSTADVLLALLGAAVPAVGIIGKLVGDARKLRTAVAATANHADRMEAAETDTDVKLAKATSRAEQVAAGVVGVIAAVRGKA